MSNHLWMWSATLSVHFPKVIFVTDMAHTPNHVTMPDKRGHSTQKLNFYIAVPVDSVKRAL